MATDHKLSATSREDAGKGASRRLRRSGKVPAIVYGGHKDPVRIQLQHNAVMLAAEHEWFYSGIIDLDIDGKVEKVLLRDLQRHPVKAQVLHLDFQRVTAGELIHTKVPLHFLNQEKSPAGKTSGVVILHELNEIEVSCLPKDLPEYIEIDLSSIKEGDVIHLSDLKLPQGVSIPQLKLGKEHDIAVVSARKERGGAEEAAGGAAEAEASSED